MAQNEPVGMGEQVLTIVREEGMAAIPPSDMRCTAAVSGGKRCAKDKWYNEELDQWWRFCEKHSAQLEKARTGEAKQVEVYSE